MAYFRPRGDYWIFTIDLPRDPLTGERKQSTVSKDDDGKKFTSESQARIYAEKMEEDIAKGKKFEKITFKQFTDRFFEEDISGIKNGRITESTYENHEAILRLWLLPYIGNLRLDKITDSTIDKLVMRWKTEKKLQLGLLRNIFAVLNKIFKYALKKRYITESPMQLVETPNYVPPRHKVWSENDVAKFMELSKDNRYYIGFVLALTTGMRIGELCSLNWDDINLEQGTVTITKTLKYTNGSKLHVKPYPKSKNSFRTIGIPEFTIEALKAHKAKQMKGVSIVFDNLGDYHYPTTVSRDFPGVCRKYSMPPIRFHYMRHTHATILLLAGIPVIDVAQRLGDTIETVMRTYAHVIPRKQEMILNKLDVILSNKPAENK